MMPTSPSDAVDVNRAEALLRLTNAEYPRVASGRMLVFDEAPQYLFPRGDALKLAVRDVAGVPNATYVVEAGRVFVFDKLVALVRDATGACTADGTPVPEQVLALLPGAWMTPLEAVAEWGVVPLGYSVRREYDFPEDGVPKILSYSIRQTDFGAVVPGNYTSKDGVERALALLLVEEAVAGDGDFVYRGQPLKLVAPFDLSLPPEPAFGLDDVPAPDLRLYRTLGNVAFVPGFSPVSEEMFNCVRDLEERWRITVAAVGQRADSEAVVLWGRIGEFPLSLLTGPQDDEDEACADDLRGLRHAYPELAALSDDVLYASFSDFQMDCYDLTGWVAERDDDFLFYLLGLLSVGQFAEGRDAVGAGKVVAFALLRGNSVDVSLEVGKAAYAYEEAVLSLAGRISAAMRFLSMDRKRIGLQGRPVTTMGEFMIKSMSAFRKVRPSTLLVTQNISDFSAEAQ